MPVSAGGRPKLPEPAANIALHLQMLPQNFRLLNLHVVFSECLCALKVLDRTLMISGLVEDQRQIVMGLSRLRIGSFRF